MSEETKVHTVAKEHEVENLLGERDNEFDIEVAVKKMQHFWETYTEQDGWEDWNENMFLRDALYGVGIAVDNEKYKFGSGFVKFITDLAKRVFKDTLKGNRIL